MAESKNGELTRDRLMSLMSSKGSSSSSSVDKKELPPRLTEDLKGSKYKPRLPLSTTSGNLLDTVLDDSVGTVDHRRYPLHFLYTKLLTIFPITERALYDEMLGPIIKPRTAPTSRPVLRPLSRDKDGTALGSSPNESGTDFNTAVLRRLAGDPLHTVTAF